MPSCLLQLPKRGGVAEALLERAEGVCVDGEVAAPQHRQRERRVVLRRSERVARLHPATPNARAGTLRRVQCEAEQTMRHQHPTPLTYDHRSRRTSNAAGSMARMMEL
eukprot:3598662-Pleurochrysis_carterae.AAC.4